MVKKRLNSYYCQSCSYYSPKWLGKCPECNKWNTFEIALGDTKAKESLKTPKVVSEISLLDYAKSQTSLSELDRVLGGGLVKGSFILIGGDPGVGKSTLLTKVLYSLSLINSIDKYLYISGEESEGQVASRAKRIGVANENFFILNEIIWEEIKNNILKLKPSVVVIDSIQTTISKNNQTHAGSLSQVKEVTYEMMNFFKAEGITCFLVGHINKEGSIAGPKVLEHMVDVVLYFEGEKLNSFRSLRCIKNRFGRTNDIGFFEMKEEGLCEIENYSNQFIDETLDGHYGRSIGSLFEGSRNMLVEVQSLVNDSHNNLGRVTCHGFDKNRLSLLMASIEKYLNIPISHNDIFLNFAGSLRVGSSDIDLAIIASLLSSYNSKPIDKDVLFIGEVGLMGEIRAPKNLYERLSGLSKMRFKRIITGEHNKPVKYNKYPMEIIGLKSINNVEMFL